MAQTIEIPENTKWVVADFMDPTGRYLAVWPAVIRNGARGCPVCLITTKQGETEKDYANAKLIAAAPELLEVLIDELQFIEEWNGNGNYTQRIEKIKEAIKKATE